ncbi:hypothetical protein HAX54_034798 [Datura stramonium]|uniref:Uncharacterized protein n=1 Tax=Datura stramonium TaxID=4076 RepID=A0ABS8SFG0_DATST|nr:hypothetical protein [Datura stramonium]
MGGEEVDGGGAYMVVLRSREKNKERKTTFAWPERKKAGDRGGCDGVRQWGRKVLGRVMGYGVGRGWIIWVGLD